jgi:hypothetical protein
MTISSILNWIGSNLQLLIVLFVFGAPILSKIVKSMREAREKRLAAIRREQLEIDALRTGQRRDDIRDRELAEEAQERRRVAAETARRQQQQQQQARAQQTAGSATRSSPGRPTGPTKQIRLPGGIVLEVPDEQSERSQPERPQPAQQQAQRQQPRQVQPQRQQQQQRPKQPAQAPAKPQRHAADFEEQKRLRKAEQQHARAQQAQQKASLQATAAITAAAFEIPANRQAQPARLAAVPGSGSFGTVTLLGNASRADLKKAIVLTEVLSKPVSMRE